jgi:hypothetical protein
LHPTKRLTTDFCSISILGPVAARLKARDNANINKLASEIIQEYKKYVTENRKIESLTPVPSYFWIVAVIRTSYFCAGFIR